MNSTTPLTRAARDVFTVSRLNRTVRELVELSLGVIWVEGEISNLSRPASGHQYFSLKDAKAQVRCAFFKQRARLSRVTLEPGKQVLVRARASLYEPRGDYQLIVEGVELAGDGLLQQRYQDNLQRLNAEGLFSADRKRALPPFPQHIGVVTSATGAAVRDVVEVLRRRYPLAPVTVYPTAVQGDSAVPGITAAIHLANDHGVADVLLIVRGGGSLEDLWAFNEESVVRAVVASAIPTVSGVGHEVDTTLCDLAADTRAPTPSAAAELVSPPLDQLTSRLISSHRRLHRHVQLRTQRARAQLTRLQARLARHQPERQVETAQQRLDLARARLDRAISAQLSNRESALRTQIKRLRAQSPARQLATRRSELRRIGAQLAHAFRHRLQDAERLLGTQTRALDAVSPLATLERGYAVVRRASDGHVVQTASHIQAGERLRITLREGELHADATDPTHE
ncbi:MAG: exodeoxyribonuclease VII large subunit [Pseudomonadota bacterium]